MIFPGKQKGYWISDQVSMILLNKKQEKANINKINNVGNMRIEEL